VYVQGYGVKDLGTGARVTPDTLFQIASTSKAFTSTALAMLVSEGKVSWDDPVRQYLPYFEFTDMCANSQVTVRDIVSHRTGLGRHDELWDNTPLTREEVIRGVNASGLARPFRTAYQYQNIMFIAAGEVAAKAAGMPWDDFVRARIFAPLNMTRTITSDEQWLASDHATGYRYDWKTDRIAPQKPIETYTLGSAGAIKSSARDMANWLRFHLGNGTFELHQLLDPAALEETKMPQTVRRWENTTRDENPETNVISYAMGWNVQDYRGELLVSHSGALNGFRTQVDLLPKRNSGFVVMVNVGRGLAVVALRNALADILLGKAGRDWNEYYLALDRREDEKEAQQKAERLSKRDAVSKPALPLASYAGEYESRSHGKATVTLEGDALVLRWSRIVAPLRHFEFDTFDAVSDEADLDEAVTFGFNAKREIESLTLFGQTFRKQPARSHQ
nr:serine hydrolase [Acidobacteriota bacterium]